jgi:hypothetical protein
MLNLKKLPLLLLLACSFALHSCKSSTEPDDNNNNNGGNNNGKVAVGNTYTSEVYVTDASFTPSGAPSQSSTAEVESITATWMGRSNVIVTGSPQAPGQKGYQVIESNGDVSIYSPMAGGPQGVLFYRWIRMPASGTGETVVNIDTNVTMNGIPTHITGQWTIKPTGTGTQEAAGKTWTVQKLQMIQTTNWELFGSSFDMEIKTDYFFAPEIMNAVRSDITMTQSSGGFDQTSYQTVRLKSYALK